MKKEIAAVKRILNQKDVDWLKPEVSGAVIKLKSIFTDLTVLVPAGDDVWKAPDSSWRRELARQFGQPECSLVFTGQYQEAQNIFDCRKEPESVLIMGRLTKIEKLTEAQKKAVKEAEAVK